MKSRDKNTSFSHKQAIARWQQNTINEINLEDGTWLSDFAAVKDVAQSHFETLYIEEEEVDPISIQAMLSNIPSLVTPEDNAELSKEIEEVKIIKDT